MDVCIQPRTLSGTLRAIPSKSEAHRMLICAALSDSRTALYLPGGSEDISATMNCLTALGARFSREGEELIVEPIQRDSIPPSPVLDCGESGSTLRFMLPVAMSLADEVSFTGHGRLPERPNAPLIDAMTAHGVKFSAEKLPLTATGRLTGGRFELAGNLSSQYITGLLLAAPQLENGAEIFLTSPAESKGYIDITRKAMEAFAVSAEETDTGWQVAAGSAYKSPEKAVVGGDWSNSAFWLTAGVLAGDGISLSGLDTNSVQGDRAVCEILSRMGADIDFDGGLVTARSQGRLRAAEIDASGIPDLVPILSVAAASAEGTTRFYNASRLRLKESDRLATTAATLTALGADVRIEGDELFVTGKERLSGGDVDGCNDHRIVMSAAIASIICENAVTITGAQAANKSYPGFFNDFTITGGEYDVIQLR